MASRTLVDELSGAPVKFVPVAAIGEGSYGRVLKAELQRDGGKGAITVAVKNARTSAGGRETEANAAAMQLLHNEGRVLKELRHPNIVKLMALVPGDCAGDLSILEEFLEGPSLAALLEKQAKLMPHKKLYTIGQALKWMRSLASALDYMHSGADTGESVFVHRDVSPGNVILTTHHLKKATVKLVDFGLTQQCPRNEANERSQGSRTSSSGFSLAPTINEDANLTENGAQQTGTGSASYSPSKAMTRQCGTWLHIAPEAFHSDDYSYKVDVFSFAMVFFQLVHYTSLIDYVHRNGFTVKAAQQAMLDGWRPTPVHSLAPEIRDLIQRCWSAEPTLRPDFRTVVQELDELCSVHVTEPPPKWTRLFGCLSPALACAADGPSHSTPAGVVYGQATKPKTEYRAKSLPILLEAELLGYALPMQLQSRRPVSNTSRRSSSPAVAGGANELSGSSTLQRASDEF